VRQEVRKASCIVPYEEMCHHYSKNPRQNQGLSSLPQGRTSGDMMIVLASLKKKAYIESVKTLIPNHET
jgi:hypothetical protein